MGVTGPLWWGILAATYATGIVAAGWIGWNHQAIRSEFRRRPFDWHRECRGLRLTREERAQLYDHHHVRVLSRRP
jgi:hypothetical protein